MSDHPPRIAEILLGKLIGTRDAEVIAGDLRESFMPPAVADAPGTGRKSPVASGFVCLRTAGHPGYAATAMLCLALGVGVNTVVFSWLDEVYFRRLAVPEPGSMVAIDHAAGPPCSWREFREFFPGLQSLTGAAAIIPKQTFLDIGSVNDQLGPPAHRWQLSAMPPGTVTSAAIQPPLPTTALNSPLPEKTDRTSCSLAAWRPTFLCPAPPPNWKQPMTACGRRLPAIGPSPYYSAPSSPSCSLSLVPT